jgi:hypothetical protein
LALLQKDKLLEHDYARLMNEWRMSVSGLQECFSVLFPALRSAPATALVSVSVPVPVPVRAPLVTLEPFCSSSFGSSFGVNVPPAGGGGAELAAVGGGSSGAEPAQLEQEQEEDFDDVLWEGEEAEEAVDGVENEELGGGDGENGRETGAQSSSSSSSMFDSTGAVPYTLVRIVCLLWI